MQDTSQREYWSGKVGDTWAVNAGRIDAMFAPLMEALFSFAAFRPGERVLDIGCGSGETSIEIARRVGRSGSVVGADLSPQMLAVARQRAREADLTVDFVEADLTSAQLEPRFDTAFSRFGVMFFDAPVVAFSHIRTLVRENGRLVLVCWRSIAENTFATLPLDAIQPMLKAPLVTPDPNAPGPYALSDAGRVRSILGEAGWGDVALSRWDGALSVGDARTLSEAADFLLKIGPCSRAVADQQLDVIEARTLLMEKLAPHAGELGIMLPAACWLVSATA